MELHNPVSKIASPRSRDKEILILLSDSTETLAEIGLRFGVSRQRIEQIALKNSALDGYSRTMLRTMKRKKERLNHLARLVALRKAAPDLQYEPISARKIKLGRLICHVVLNFPSRLKYLGFGVPRRMTQHEGLLAVTPLGVYVFPPGIDLPTQVMFAVNGDKRYGVHGFRHDYPNYLNAWHLLEPFR